MAKDCSICQHFSGFYTKTYCGYYREKFGYCGKNKKICDKHDCCDDYKYKTHDKKIKAGFVINALNEALTNINTIKDILEERELEK